MLKMLTVFIILFILFVSGCTRHSPAAITEPRNNSSVPERLSYLRLYNAGGVENGVENYYYNASGQAVSHTAQVFDNSISKKWI
jgi:hypothetical protein